MGCATSPKFSCQSPPSISPHQHIPPPHRIPGKKPQNTVKLSALRVFQDSIGSPPEKTRCHKCKSQERACLRPDVRVEVQRVCPKQERPRPDSQNSYSHTEPKSGSLSLTSCACGVGLSKGYSLLLAFEALVEECRPLLLSGRLPGSGLPASLSRFSLLPSVPVCCRLSPDPVSG